MVTGITLPIDRAEERLMLRTLAPAPILPGCTVGLHDVVQLVDSADSGELIFGTDGGMKWSVTSWAVSHPSGLRSRATLTRKTPLASTVSWKP